MDDKFTPVIDKDVPLPNLAIRGIWQILSEMEVGESVFFPEGYCKSVVRAWRGNSRVSTKHPDRKFTSRAVDGGVRVWRYK